jgi:hypothetical protein
MSGGTLPADEPGGPRGPSHGRLAPDARTSRGTRATHTHGARALGDRMAVAPVPLEGDGRRGRRDWPQVNLMRLIER